MLLTIPWCIFMYVHSQAHTYFFLEFIDHFLTSIYSIHKRYENPYLSTFLGEIIGLSILWLLWLVGAATASVSDFLDRSLLLNSNINIVFPPCQTMWGTLEWCQTFAACRILSALLAFSWSGWLVLSFLLGFSLLFSFANKGFMDPLHGRWNPRESRYPDTVIRV